MSQPSPDMTLQPFEGIAVGDSLRVTVASRDASTLTLLAHDAQPRQPARSKRFPCHQAAQRSRLTLPLITVWPGCWRLSRSCRRFAWGRPSLRCHQPVRRA
jgi:hypothetical protein